MNIEKIQIIILQGVPASGKSTYAKQFLKDNPNWICINKDYLRMMMRQVEYDINYEVLVEEFEVILLEKAISKKQNIIIDSCNVTLRHLTKIINCLPAFDIDIKLICFDVDIATAKERNELRGGAVTNKVIDKAYKSLMAEKKQILNFLKQQDVKYIIQSQS